MLYLDIIIITQQNKIITYLTLVSQFYKHLVLNKNYSCTTIFFLIFYPGSLAKGTAENVSSLVEQGTATALVELLKTAPIGTKLTEAGLCALRSVFMHPPAPIASLPADMRLLTRLTRKFLLYIIFNSGFLIPFKCFSLHYMVWEIFKYYKF